MGEALTKSTKSRASCGGAMARAVVENGDAAERGLALVLSREWSAVLDRLAVKEEIMQNEPKENNQEVRRRGFSRVWRGSSGGVLVAGKAAAGLRDAAVRGRAVAAQVPEMRLAECRAIESWGIYIYARIADPTRSRKLGLISTFYSKYSC